MVGVDDKWDYLEYRLHNAKQNVASKKEAYTIAEEDLVNAWCALGKVQREIKEARDGDSSGAGREAEITGTTEGSGES